MRLIEKVLDFFRKKEYYVLDYKVLNTFSISFRELTDIELDKIRILLEELKAKNVKDNKNEKLFLKEATTFLSVNLLLESIRKVVSQDYKKTYFEATSNNWDFLYFLTDYKPIYKDSLAICNKLSSSTDKNRGDIIYPILIIKKNKSNIYYLWNLLEDYEEL